MDKEEKMVTVVGVKFRDTGKSYHFAPGDFDIPKDTAVIVETSRGIEIGTCDMTAREISLEKVKEPLKKVLRIATAEDLERREQNRQKEKDAFEICRKKIEEHNLQMNLTDVEVAFDNSKILFFFTADGRVDFRELVRDLAGVFKTRIELRQIGVRDEARMFGGLGICGNEFCCTRFLDDFQPVSIKMAKDQGLSLNPTKISGTCGRLMCCLKYEQDAYAQLLKLTPTVGSFVETPEGRGTVSDVSLISGDLKVFMEKSPEAAPKTFNRSQVKILKKPQKSGDKKLAEEFTNLE